MEQRQDPPRMWLTRRAISLHVTLVVVVPLFLGLFWWQVQRVREGNTLSWAYVFEWPFFTGYAVYLWWKLVHEQPGTEDARVAAPGEGPATSVAATATPVASRSGSARASTDDTGPAPPAGGEDEDLAAYNRYLAELNATGRAKRW